MKRLPRECGPDRRGLFPLPLHVMEGDKVIHARDIGSAREFSRASPERFGKLTTTVSELHFDSKGGQRMEMTQSFVSAILDGSPLIAPAYDGIH